MDENLRRVSLTLHSGSEPLHSGEAAVGPTLREFWQWSASDLVDNTTRGALAEFIVASALGIPINKPRESWAAYDLTTPDGITIEVKSAAYVQSWHQKRLSNIIFKVRHTRGWSADTNEMEKEARRKAQVYVFALLAHKDKATVDPLDLAQWQFYVLPTTVLNARSRSQHSITLPSLQALSGGSVPYAQLRNAVERAAAALPTL